MELEDIKNYKSMTAEEQLKWITDFSKFDAEKLPTLCALGDVWESSHIKCFEEGLKLLYAFRQCQEFVKNSVMFRDYSRRVDRMTFYIDFIKKQIEKGNALRGKNGQTLVNVPPLQPMATRRRGRPTKAESEIIAAEKQEKKDDSFNLFSAMGIVAGSQEDPALPHISQIAWMLSPALREECKQISFYRGQSASEAEKAKALAENGDASEIIAPHARAAAEYTEKYKKVYEDINSELATLYGMLSIDENYGDLKSEIEKKGSNIEALKVLLLQYFNKMDEEWKAAAKTEIEAAKAPKKIKTVEEETAEINEAEKKQRLHTIRTYMLRTDVNLTEKRIEKMRDCIAEAEGLGEDVSEYKVILAKAEEDFKNAQETPNQEEE